MKTVNRKVHRFESCSLRQNKNKNPRPWKFYRIGRGIRIGFMRRDAREAEWVRLLSECMPLKGVPGVRIPLSPPYQKRKRP